MHVHVHFRESNENRRKFRLGAQLAIASDTSQDSLCGGMCQKSTK